MKPIKNRFHCVYSGRVKMLFTTEKKANTFMKFNNDTIESENGFKPIRAYFCICCNGWHLTSKQRYERNTITQKNEKIESTISIENKSHKTITKEIINEVDKEINENVNITEKSSIRLIKICEEYKIGMAELILIFKNHNIFVKRNPNTKIDLNDLDVIKYRLK